MTRGRLKSRLIPMVVETYQAMQEIETLTGESLGMHQTGCLYAAVSPDHKKEIDDLASTSSQARLAVEWLGAADVQQLVPWLKVPQESSLLFMPDDGYIDGYTLAMGYLKSARLLGVEIRQQTPVLSIIREGSVITGVKTAHGNLSAGLVIDAAGVWAGLLALEIGIAMPMAPIRSHYWITTSYQQFSPDQPFVILPDARAYARPEGNSLLFGFRESQSASVDPRKLPDKMDGFIFSQDPEGWESATEGIPEFAKFFPFIDEIGIFQYIKGLSNYTPDGNFVLGKFPALDGFLAATGCAGAGIAMSGGIGRFVAELAADRVPFVDFSTPPHRPLWSH